MNVTIPIKVKISGVGTFTPPKPSGTEAPKAPSK